MNKMRKKTLLCLFAALMIASAGGCEKTGNSTDSTDNQENNDQQSGQDEQEEQRDYPKGVSVTEFKDDLGNGKFCSGYIATVDFKENPDLKFNVNYSIPMKKPSEVYANFSQRKGKPCIVINGGYFAGATSMSIARIDGYTECTNPRSINWPNDKNFQKTVYPVRSAFGQMEDGSFEAQWAYCIDPSSREHYSFPSTMGNNEKNKTFIGEPLTKETPGGKPWHPEEAIGGGPRLVKDRKNIALESYWGEVLDSGGTAGTSRQPRTAIGKTRDNSIILIVCDGRGMNGSSGFTLNELANKLISLGATDAINLDGGGSSAMIGAGGKVLNRPSGSGNGETIVERKVITTVVISEMQK